MRKNALSHEEKLHDPCEQICVTDPASELCLGCGRTPDEINSWPSLSRSTKENILDETVARLESLEAIRRKKRAGRRRARKEV